VYTQAGYNSTLNLSDNFCVDILLPTLDYIEITDGPDGNPLGNVILPLFGSVLAYASGYNNTGPTFVHLVNVNWSGGGGWWSPEKGPSSTFYASNSSGLYTQTAENTSLGVSDTFEIKIVPYVLDRIILTHTPNGTELVTVFLDGGGQVAAYASGYNSTGPDPHYVGLVNVYWDESAGLGSFNNLTGTSTIFTAGFIGGLTTINGNEPKLRVNDSFDVRINATGTVDYIQIRSQPGGGGENLGNPANYPSYPVGYSTIFYGAAYNNTLGYIGNVNTSSTWNCSDPTIVEIISPGSSSTVTCSDTNWGTVTITLDDGEGHQNTTQVTVLEPTIDYIVLTDAPNGIELSTVILGVGDKISIYASSYNLTSGFIGLIEVNWYQSPTLGSFDNLTGTSTTFTGGFKSGITTITGESTLFRMNDTLDVIIAPPIIDYIRITDAPNGTTLITLTIPAGENVTAFASGYNITSGYIGLIEVNWSQSPTLGSFDNLTGTSTTFTSGLTGGLATITGENLTLGISDSFEVNITTATVDFIQIRDAPSGGGSVVTNLILNVGESFTLWTAAYNHSIGYVGQFSSTIWTETTGGSVITVISPGALTKVQAQLIGGSSTITANYNGTQNTTSVTVNPPEADYLLIRTQPGGGGTNLCDPGNYKTHPVGISDTYYGAMYNLTAGFFADVPSTATWLSSDTSIVTITSPGSSAKIKCDNRNWGGPVTITISSSGNQNTTQVTVLEPTIDYIHVWQVDEFYAAAYNNTADYLREVEAVWESDDTTVGTVTSPGLWTNFTAQKILSDSICYVMAEYDGMTDSTDTLTVLAPRIDYIIIVDSPNKGGVWVGDRTYNEGDHDAFWAAGFNYTVAYVKDVKATWESDNNIVGKVTSGPNENSNFTAGWRGGYCKVTTIYGTLKNETGVLFVINVNQLPTARATFYNGTGFPGGNFSFSTNITLRVTGRKQNIITMGLEEDGVIVKEVEVTRHSSQPDIGVISYEMDAQKVYRVVLTYNGHNGGSNPMIVSFEFLGNIYSVHLLFNSQDGIEQEAIIEFNDVLPLVGVVFVDASLSIDFEGYLIDYQWNFGDGTTGSGETLAHTYAENGIFTITLTVTDDEGGTDSTIIIVPVENIDDNDQANAIPNQKGSKGYLNESGECVVILQCPADLLIANLEGQQIGLSNGLQINEIEGAFIAMLYSDVEVYYIPMNNNYSAEVDGTGSGLYDLSVIRVSNNVTKKYGVEDVTCSESTLDVYIFDFKNEEISISTNEEEKLYSLGLSTLIEDQWDHFNLTNMRLNKDTTHIYIINNWEVLSYDKPVSLFIDEDSDGNIDKSMDLETDLTGDEVEAFLLKQQISEPAFPILLVVIVGSICAVGVGSILTEVGRWALLMMFLPLYTRIKKENMLDHPTRDRIYGYLIGNPGAYFGLIKEDLNMGNGQLGYHLKQLMNAKMIYSREDGVKKRFYPAEIPKPKGGSPYFSDLQETIHGIIKNNSGIGQKKIASVIGISRQVAGYHLRKMERKGVIRRILIGRENKYYTIEDCSF
jgi:predicted transcriptional regulator